MESSNAPWVGLLWDNVNRRMITEGAHQRAARKVLLYAAGGDLAQLKTDPDRLRRELAGILNRDVGSVDLLRYNESGTLPPEIGALLLQAAGEVVPVNRAVAVAMRDGPAAGLALIQGLNKEGELAGDQWLYSAQADLHRRLGQAPEAQAAYRKALSMSQQEPERGY
jgi:hypothetical protein